MKRNKVYVKNHHPFCQDTYLNKSNPLHSYLSWNCICDILKTYDTWRAKSKQNKGE